MKSLLVAMTFVLSTAAFANDKYSCSLKIDGYLSASVTDIEVEYGLGGVSLALDENHIIELDIKSTGRSNRMPRNRIAYAVMFDNKVMNRHSVEFDGLPLELGLTKDSGDLDVKINCTLN